MFGDKQNGCITRRRSIQLPPHPDVPIPPTLVQSPYLDCESIFRRSFSGGPRPTEEDEKWLQDTVPIASIIGPQDDDFKNGQLSSLPSTSSHSQPASPQRSLSRKESLGESAQSNESPGESAQSSRTLDIRLLPLGLDIPHSPPIVLGQRQTTTRRRLHKHLHSKVQSTPCFTKSAIANP